MHCIALTLFHIMYRFLFSLCIAFTLYPFIYYILFLLLYISQVLSIHTLHFCLFFYESDKLYLFMHCILLLLVYISHKTWSFFDLFFSLTCIKTSTQLYVKKIQVNRYKTLYWPIRLLFSFVYIAWMHIFINLYFISHSYELENCSLNQN